MDSKKETAASHIAYERFRELLSSRQLQAGQRITQKELLDMLGMSLSPVRIALIRLEAEGYLHIYPQRGIQIAERSMPLYQELQQTRIALEKEAWVKFAVGGSAASIDIFLQKQKGFAARIAAKDTNEEFYAEVQQADRLLHRYVMQHMGNSRLLEQFRIVTDIARCLRDDRINESNAERSVLSHIAILEACKTKDILAILSAVEDHLMISLIYFFE